MVEAVKRGVAALSSAIQQVVRIGLLFPSPKQQVSQHFHDLLLRWSLDHQDKTLEVAKEQSNLPERKVKGYPSGNATSEG